MIVFQEIFEVELSTLAGPSWPKVLGSFQKYRFLKMFGSTDPFVIRCFLFMSTIVTNDDLISYFFIFSETRFQRTSPKKNLALKNQLIQKIRCGCKWLPPEFEISLRPSSMICCSFCSYDDFSKQLEQKDFRFQNCTENVLVYSSKLNIYMVAKNLTDFTIKCRGLNY